LGLDKIENTFIDGFGGGFHGLNREGEEREFVAGNGVTDFVHDFRNGYELVGEAVELFAGFDDCVGVHDGDGDGIGGFGGFQHYWNVVLRWWRWLLLQHVAPA